MKATQWKTQRSGLLLFMGACFCLPGLVTLWQSAEPTDVAVALVFMLIGGAIAFLGWRGQRINALADVENEPWTLNADWQGGPIYSDGKLALAATLIFTVVWNLTVCGALWLVGESLLEERNPVGLILVVFALIAPVLIYKSIKLLLLWRKFGRTPLLLSPFPGQLAGVVRGQISINQMLGADSDATVTVVAMRRTRNSKNTSETPVWQRRRKAVVHMSATGCNVRFDVPIDKDLPSTDYPATSSVAGSRQNRSVHYWQLRVEHAASGLDRVFNIPVYQVAVDQLEQSVNQEPEIAYPGRSSTAANDHWFGLPDVQQPAPATELPTGTNNASKSLRIHFPLSHGMGMHGFLLVFGLVFFGAGTLIGTQVGSWFGWMFGSVFLLIGMLLSLISLIELLTTKTVLFDTRSVRVSTRLFGIVVRLREIEYAQITAFKTKRSGSTSSGNRQHKIYYNVYGELANAKVVNVAWLVEGDEAANGLSEYLNDLIDVA